MKRVKKIIKVFLKNFSDTDIMTLSNDLTYVTLISIFPFLSIILGFSKGFGLDVYILDKINSLISTTDSQLNIILDITRNLLNSLSSGLLTGLGIVLVFWTVIGLLQKIEVSFNKVWQIKTNNGFFKNIMNYIAIIILVPIFIILFIATNDKITNLLLDSGYLTSLSIFIFSFLRLSILLLFFTFIYQKVPKTVVTLKSSFISAFIVVMILYILSSFYKFIFVMISKYNAIYGSLTFIPLFLLWVKYLWVIVLTGAQITYSIDSNFEEEDDELSIRYKKSISIYILNKVMKRFINNEENYSITELSKDMSIKIYAVRICVEILQDMGYIICHGVNEDVVIQINKNPETLTTLDFVKDFENESYRKRKGIIEDMNDKEVTNIYKQLEPCDNQLVKDLSI